MPQLDGYLIFSEIFWFVLLFCATYLMVYKFVAKLHIGLRSRWAFLADAAGFGGEFRAEHRLVTGSWHVPMERDILDLSALETFIGLQVRLLQEHTGLLGLRNSAVTGVDAFDRVLSEGFRRNELLDSLGYHKFHISFFEMRRLEEAKRAADFEITKRNFQKNVDYAGF